MVMVLTDPFEEWALGGGGRGKTSRIPKSRVMPMIWTRDVRWKWIQKWCAEETQMRDRQEGDEPDLAR